MFRVNSNSIKKPQYRCLVCNRTFICCANKDRGLYSKGKTSVSNVRARIASYRYMIKQLETDIAGKYY